MSQGQITCTCPLLPNFWPLKSCSNVFQTEWVRTSDQIYTRAYVGHVAGISVESEYREDVTTNVSTLLGSKKHFPWEKLVKGSNNFSAMHQWSRLCQNNLSIFKDVLKHITSMIDLCSPKISSKCNPSIPISPCPFAWRESPTVLRLFCVQLRDRSANDSSLKVISIGKMGSKGSLQVVICQESPPCAKFSPGNIW